MTTRDERLFVMKPELLAPVNLRTLSAAVSAGADAVYLGGTDFGARKFADNFDREQMEKAVDFCHLRGVKVYLASNILVSDGEIREFLSFITDAYNMGVDAFILQDAGMAAQIKDKFPDARLHASTQMTVHNTEGAAYLKNLGFERVVTARELGSKDIKEIAEKSGVETEIFVHGALCMSYSGQCLMSSMIGGRSGNRGSCAQPCRLPYELSCNGKVAGRGYYLSPRDLSLAGDMKEVIKSGAASLKIEGRMKGPEYVAAAVSVLRRLVDENRNCTAEELKMLETAFSRDGFTSGMFKGDNDRYINCSRGNDDIYKNRDEDLLKNLKLYTDERANLKKLPVSFSAEMYVGSPFKIIARSGETDVTVIGVCVQKAQNKPTDEETVKKQIAKTGDYSFFADKIYVKTDGQAFLPLSDINNLRRQSLEKLQEKIIRSYKKNADCPVWQPPGAEQGKTKIKLAAQVTTAKQLEIVRNSGIERILVPCELDPSENEVAVFPDIIHNEYLEKYFQMLETGKYSTVCSANYAIIERAAKLGKKIVSSPALNIFNSESANFWNKSGIGEMVVSQELNLKQISALKTDAVIGAIIYGRAVMMKMAVCPVKAAIKKCGGETCKACLKDRKNEQFPVICNGMTSFVLNSKPVYMADKLSDLERAGVQTGIIHFTDENADETRRIIDAYSNGRQPEISFTRGHFYRGVT